MLIQLYDQNNAVHLLKNAKTGRIDHEENGEDKLSFYLDTDDDNYRYICEEAKIVYGDNNWVVKKIQDDSVECEIDFDFLKGSLLTGYEYRNATLSEVLEAMLPSEWTITGASELTAKSSTRYAYATPFKVVHDLMAEFDVRFIWKTRTKELVVRIPSNIQPSGKYISDQLNLKSLTFQGSSTDIVTRLFPYGKDGLSIVSVNEGVPYIDNNSYTGKTLVTYWVDERYEEPQPLKDAAIKKLAEMALPVRSYECSIKDLAKLTNKYSILSISMHDKMTLMASQRGLSVVYSVVKYVEYPDSPEDNIVTLSCVPETIQSMVKSDTERLEEKIQSQIDALDYTTPEELSEAIQRATDAITGNSGGYVVLFPANNPEELLIMNKPLRSEATKLWRFNLSGLGYSRNGYDGPYELAITMNGEINASMVTTGTLNAIDITACTITGGTLNINDKCTIDANGHLHAIGATFEGGTVEKIVLPDSIPAGKYHIGDTSPTYGLSSTEISDNIKSGIVYVPLATHSEGTETAEIIDVGTPLSRASGEGSGEIEEVIDAGTPASSRTGAEIIDAGQPEDRAGMSYILFTVGKFYTWDGTDWTEAGIVSFSSAYVQGHADYELWYCQADIAKDGRSYSKKTLYLWLGDRWNAVADGYETTPDASGVVSIIGGRITAEYIEAMQISVDAAQITGTLDASHINANDLYVNAANITGRLSAAQVDVSGIIRAGQIVVGTDIFTSGRTTIDGGKITSGSISATQIDASNLHVNAANITGTLTVRSASNYTLISAGNNAVFIGGFIVQNNGTYSSIVSSSSISMTSGNYTGIYLGTNGIHVCGKNASNIYKHFKVDGATGKMYAEDAEITGRIVATSGSFTGTVDATDGTFRGTIYATAGSFSGSIEGELQDGIKVGTGGHCTLSSYNSGHGNTGCELAYDGNTYLRMGQGSQGNEVWLTSGRYVTIRAGAYGATSAEVYIVGPYITLGDQNTGTTDGRLFGNWTLNGSTIATTSDARKKNSIAKIGDKYGEFFDNLNPVMFRYNSGTSGRLHAGFIAQEVKTALDTAGISTKDFAGYVESKDVDGEDYLCLRYEEFIAISVLEIQKLKARVAELEKITNL